MKNPILFFLLNSIAALAITYFAYLVWFQYSKWVDWAQKMTTWGEKFNKPLGSFSRSLIQSPVYKWYTRIIALFMLVVVFAPFLLMIVAFLANRE